MSYALPPQDVIDIIDAPPTPLAVTSPDRSALLLVAHEAYPPIELLAHPFLRLGGIRVDPATGTRHRATRLTGISILSTSGGAPVEVPIPDGVSIGMPVWSHDSSRIAFTVDAPDGTELWTADASTGQTTPLQGLRVTDVSGAAFTWMRDNTSLLVRSVPGGRGTPPHPAQPSPRIEETSGKRSQMATFQDLLSSPEDEDLFEYYATAQLAVVDVQTARVQAVGEPGMYTGARLSPDSSYLLINRVKRPFSYRVPFAYFTRSVEVWDMQGRQVATIADLPISDEVPRQGVPTGPRSAMWQQRKDATLLWAEALDGGDPIVKVDHRDRLMTLAAPFDASPREVLKTQHRFAGCDWLEAEDTVLLTERDRDRRWRTTWLVDLAEPEADRKVLFDLSIHDAYNNPGAPVYRTTPDGQRFVVQEGDWIYLSGRGASEQGDRPFLDRMNLGSGLKERLFECAESRYEVFAGLASTSLDTILIRSESRTDPPNFVVQSLADGSRRPLTSFPDPHPQITGVHKQMLRYERDDGVTLSGTLYLPPGYALGSGVRLPVVIWAYPYDYSDPATAGQVRGSDHTFTRLGGTSPLWFLTQGYAVLLDATMPVVGDPETMNDTFVEQIVDSAKAAIDKLDEMGVADPERVVISGHSYGGFMTANLLAHTDLFVAGIGRSGAYNRSLTPFGFQTERRSYWEAPDVYHRVSPFTYAHRIAAPLLLIHGMDDNNSGTFPIQSERLFQAIQGNGGTARLVLLPHESHGYRARESVLHTLAEMLVWAERYAPVRQDERQSSMTGAAEQDLTVAR